MPMLIQKNSRQMPIAKNITSNKDYCDLLYAWLQVKSTRPYETSADRVIDKSYINWSAIEREFSIMVDGKLEKRMGRKLIAKSFAWLEEHGYIYFDAENQVYVLPAQEAATSFLVEYNTLAKLTNVLQKRSISIYLYILNRYIANYYEAFPIKLAQIKEFIGITANTSSNNIFILDTFEILKRLGLMDFELRKIENDRTMYFIKWVKNTLPPLD